MTKLSNFFQNPLNKDFEAVKNAGDTEQATRAEKEAAEIFGDKTFQNEYKGVASASRIVALFAAIISFSTALFAVQSILYFTVGTVLSWGAAVVLCGLFEVLKTLLWRITVKQKLRYKNAAAGLIITLFFLHCISLLSSSYGAYLIPENFASPAMVVDSIAQKTAAFEVGELASLDGQIQNIDKQISDLTPYILTPSGKKSSVTAGQISTLQKQKGELIAQKADAKKVLEKSKEAAATVASANQNLQNEKIKTIQSISIAFAVFFELLYLVCSIFGFYYKFRIYIDSNLAGAHPAPVGAHPARKKRIKPANTVGAHLNTVGAHPAAAPATARKIGFNNTGAHPETIARDGIAKGEISAHLDCLAEITTNGRTYKVVRYKAKGDLEPVFIDIVLAEIEEKLYTRERIASNLRAALSKEKNGEKTAADRAAFWADVRDTVNTYAAYNPQK